LSFPVYLDADVHPIVARILRGRGFDALATFEAGQLRATDREQLDFAVARDQIEVGELVRRLTRVLGRYSAPDMINRFVWLQSFA
jgi:hypothetical protein